jgi:hypothetical protein
VIASAILGMAAACSKKEPERATDPTVAAFDDFARRLDNYVKIRNTLADSVGELDTTKSQAEIATRASDLAKAIAAARPQAKQGDIFSPEVATIIATLISQEYGRRSEPVQETRDDQQDELPDFVPEVNQLYPTTYPLATFPPTLLPLLPELPEQLEYRIVQRYLILRDVEANLIVDFMPNAIPGGS